MSEMPKSYWETISPLIERARGFLEDGSSLHPVAFVGSFEKRTLNVVVLDARDRDTKNASAERVRQTAYREDADFVFSIMEAWGCRRRRWASVRTSWTNTAPSRTRPMPST